MFMLMIWMCRLQRNQQAAAEELGNSPDLRPVSRWDNDIGMLYFNSKRSSATAQHDHDHDICQWRPLIWIYCLLLNVQASKKHAECGESAWEIFLFIKQVDILLIQTPMIKSFPIASEFLLSSIPAWTNVQMYILANHQTHIHDYSDTDIGVDKSWQDTAVKMDLYQNEYDHHCNCHLQNNFKISII